MLPLPEVGQCKNVRLSPRLGFSPLFSTLCTSVEIVVLPCLIQRAIVVMRHCSLTRSTSPTRGYCNTLHKSGNLTRISIPRPL